jgi:predicted transglutaminase-like cysteine proteinase
MAATIKAKVMGVVSALALASALSGCATSLPTSSAMPIGGVAVAPSGFISFCQREPDQCGLGAAKSNAEVDDAIARANHAQWAALFAQAPGGFVNVASTTAEPGHYNWAAVFAAAEAQAPAAKPRGPAEAASALEARALDVQVGPDRPGAAPSSAFAAAFAAEAPPHMDEPLMHVLDSVNRDINSRITPGEDAEVFGRADYWALPLSRGLGKRGNCKHYALEKRKALTERGVPASALSLAIVRTRWGEVHAVLLVATDRGEFVLDNLSPWVAPWKDTGYVWLERQTPGDPLQWRTLAAMPSGPLA